MTSPIKYYIVGGYVRDKLLGVKSKDIDFAVEAPSFEAMVADIEAKGGQIFLSKPEFLTVRAKVPHHECAADYVLCRKESFYSDGRRPDSVSIGTIYDDLARRDFTVNAIAEDEDGNILDPFGGQDDLKKGFLRCVGVTHERFEEDYLRLLRAMRFSITKGLELDREIEMSFYNPDIIAGLAKVSAERIYEELRKCFDYSTVSTLEFLDGFPHLKFFIFQDIGIRLSPKMPE